MEKSKTRETAAARREREAAEIAESRRLEQEALLLAWPSRLMTNLERASQQHGWSIRVKNGKFQVYYLSDEAIFNLVPAGEYHCWDEKGDWHQMEELEQALDSAEEEARERQRRENLRQAAYAKLSPEEREVLGLKS